MLIPYVLIEYPAGWIADRFIGDKEFMFVGFLIAGASLASISLLTPTSSLFLILCILVMSRAGGALIESMTEGHFFRRVSEKDINSISVFRGVYCCESHRTDNWQRHSLLRKLPTPLRSHRRIYCSRWRHDDPLYKRFSLVSEYVVFTFLFN